MRMIRLHGLTRILHPKLQCQKTVNVNIWRCSSLLANDKQMVVQRRRVVMLTGLLSKKSTTHKEYEFGLTKKFFTRSQLNRLNQSNPRTCWKCGGDTNPEKELFFCECGVVQQPAKCVTFFELLRIEHSFDIDTRALSKKFKDAQRLLHPDKFSTKSEEEQYFAEEQSSLLNKSYETLLKPLSRAIYLLELEDVTISENDSLSDSEFLMSVMEDFETISNASSPDGVAPLEKNNDLRIENCIVDLSKAFASHELANAKSLAIKLRYFTTIQERIKEHQLKFIDS